MLFPRLQEAHLGGRGSSSVDGFTIWSKVEGHSLGRAGSCIEFWICRRDWQVGVFILHGQEVGTGGFLRLPDLPSCPVSSSTRRFSLTKQSGHFYGRHFLFFFLISETRSCVEPRLQSTLLSLRVALNPSCLTSRVLGLQMCAATAGSGHLLECFPACSRQPGSFEPPECPSASWSRLTLPLKQGCCSGPCPPHPLACLPDYFYVNHGV